MEEKEEMTEESNVEEVVEEVEEEIVEDVTEEENEEALDSSEESKPKMFSRKEKKEKKDKKDLKIDELNERIVRLMAEYDNYRKRTDREKSSMYELGAKGVIEKVIPLIDNFERGFASVTEENKEDPFIMGMDKVYQQFILSLEEIGVTPIETIGKEFDPNMHNAVMHIDDEAFGTNEIVEEFQKGYMYKESVVRFSMVKVAN